MVPEEIYRPPFSGAYRYIRRPDFRRSRFVTPRRSDRPIHLTPRGPYRSRYPIPWHQDLENFKDPDIKMKAMDLEDPSKDIHGSVLEIRTPTKQQSAQMSSPPTLERRSYTPSPIAEATPSREPRRPSDIWETRYILEQRLLMSPPSTKPSAISFFTDHPTKLTRESAHSPRKVTSAYSPEGIFGTGPERKAELRQLEVRFAQIWRREVIKMKWERHAMDHQGYLEIEEKEMKIHLQRHHVPGTLFVCSEGGSLDINDPSNIFPDVYYQIVDAPGQEFVRCENMYDLKIDVEVQGGDSRISLEGIDGDLFMVEIENGESELRIKGKGLPRDYEGSFRGDLIIRLVKSK
jgi:hypothetical protein